MLGSFAASDGDDPGRAHANSATGGSLVFIKTQHPGPDAVRHARIAYKDEVEKTLAVNGLTEPAKGRLSLRARGLVKEKPEALPVYDSTHPHAAVSQGPGTIGRKITISYSYIYNMYSGPWSWT